MYALIQKALSLWGLQGAACEFVAGRENRVYRVSCDAGRYALRLRRPGYRSRSELLSELQWLEALYDAGLSVPRPVRTLSGAPIEHIDAHFIDVITWLDGPPLGRSGQLLALDGPETVFHGLGIQIANLHKACDAWTPPADFVRCEWNVDGLLGDAPLWGRFWDNPMLDRETGQLLTRFRQRALRDLRTHAGNLDYGLIHADLVRENVLLDGPDLHLIDFDDGGYGYRLFDIATALIKNCNEPRYAELKEALVAGYRHVRPLDTGPLDLFLALRAVTYVGWIVPRMHEDGAAERNSRFIASARRLCSHFLDTPEIL